MKKADLIKAVAAKSGETSVVVRQVLDATREVVQAAVNKHDEVFLLGLGKLEVRQRDQRPARNLHTGAKVMVPARSVVVFLPSDGLRAAANGEVAPTGANTWAPERADAS